MSDFKSRWKTPLGIKNALEIVSALKSDQSLDEYLNDTSLSDKYSDNDRYFDQLFDLRGMVIDGQAFSNCSFSYLNLSYCIFTNCNFFKVNMFNSRMHESYFRGCEFMSCGLEAIYGCDTRFEDVNWKMSSFSSSYLIGPQLIKSSIADCDFSSSRLVSPDFTKTKIINSDFSWARVAPTESFIKAVKKNKKTINLNAVEWLSPDGKAIKNPFEKPRLFKLFGSMGDG
ncbi:pentapeptide repeat-containing protein [Microbulbifer echini]|uniref:Pentapeptide repeat-containing protein n=1 Tax=Microbulbifer echini TaxID=1529067 RepID=A0ABV4NT09_9GAMM